MTPNDTPQALSKCCCLCCSKRRGDTPPADLDATAHNPEEQHPAVQHDQELRQLIIGIMPITLFRGDDTVQKTTDLLVALIHREREKAVSDALAFLSGLPDGLDPSDAATKLYAKMFPPPPNAQ